MLAIDSSRQTHHCMLWTSKIGLLVQKLRHFKGSRERSSEIVAALFSDLRECEKVFLATLSSPIKWTERTTTINQTICGHWRSAAERVEISGAQKSRIFVTTLLAAWVQSQISGARDTPKRRRSCRNVEQCPLRRIDAAKADRTWHSV